MRRLVERTVKDVNGTIVPEVLSTGWMIAGPETTALYGSTIFSMGYMFNDLRRHEDTLENCQVNHYRLTDMIQSNGFAVSGTIVLPPNQTWRVRFLVLTTSDYLSTSIVSYVIDDKAHHHPGWYSSSARLLSFEPSGLCEALSDVFPYEAKDTTHMTNAERLMLSAPRTKNQSVRMNAVAVYRNNSQNKGRRFRFNYFRKMFTTFKYPPTHTDGSSDTSTVYKDHQDPDRRMYLLILAHPVVFAVPDPDIKYMMGGGPAPLPPVPSGLYIAAGLPPTDERYPRDADGVDGAPQSYINDEGKRRRSSTIGSVRDPKRGKGADGKRVETVPSSQLGEASASGLDRDETMGAPEPEVDVGEEVELAEETIRVGWKGKCAMSIQPVLWLWFRPQRYVLRR
ncbi:hypothetical protein C8Q72DRAFT_892201 [Fomitopsis betulina]|nr:hypothetical protein C8Q72DRAFT_892201 [Fomitopsis betulina]